MKFNTTTKNEKVKKKINCHTYRPTKSEKKKLIMRTQLYGTPKNWIPKILRKRFFFVLHAKRIWWMLLSQFNKKKKNYKIYYKPGNNYIHG